MLGSEKGAIVLKPISANRQSGVTLIELIIGIVILAILLALAMPNFKAWVANGRIRTAAESILNGLQLARAEAIKQNVPMQFALGTRSNWTVGCPASVLCTTNVPAIQTRREGEGSSSDVTVAASDGTTITFDNFGRMIDPKPGAGFTVISVDINTSVLSAAESKDLNIVIFTGGNTKMCDPNVATVGDSRRCP
jgi:type IV fimbrial biogenesis protein FimT